MKIAFVVGFFGSVKTALNECYPECNYSDRLIWIDAGGNCLNVFKERFYDLVKTAESVLICLGRAGSQRHLEKAVNGIVGTAQAQYSTPIRFEAFGNIYDPLPVIEVVKSFGLDLQPLISPQSIRAKVADGKILCVSLEGKTSILTALGRAQFSAEAIHECFDEEILQSGRNSNLMQHLESYARGYTCLLYAWDGLRTSTPDVKAKFVHGCHEARSASQVAELFKKWIAEDV